MQEIVGMVTDDDGAISITASDAVKVADAMRGRIKHFHNLLSAPKKQSSSKSVHIAWIRDLLKSWGFDCIQRDRISNGSNGADQHRYTYEHDALLTQFVHRKTAIHLSTLKTLEAA